MRTVFRNVAFAVTVGETAPVSWKPSSVESIHHVRASITLPVELTPCWCNHHDCYLLPSASTWEISCGSVPKATVCASWYYVFELYYDGAKSRDWRSGSRMRALLGFGSRLSLPRSSNVTRRKCGQRWRCDGTTDRWKGM